MKILTSSSQVFSTEIVTTKTDLGVDIVETLVDNNSKSLVLHYPKNPEYRPVILDPKAFKNLKDYDNFGEFIEKSSISPKWKKKTKKEIRSGKEFTPELENSNIYFSYYSGYILFDSKLNPVSLPYIFSYIGSLREKKRNDPLYKKLITLLKAHPFTLQLDDEQIPYYNADFSGQHGIARAKVLLDDATYLKLYKHCRKKNNTSRFRSPSTEDYWSCRMTDYMKLNECYTDFNIYGDEIFAAFKEWAKTERPERESDDN